ncbi:hypothetical protein M2138_000969 [Dysgonomonadaceae bacterium PH5-43]|nr:hypothetical protein [Dysgonomonadaceae bacterium PH5-43]
MKQIKTIVLSITVLFIIFCSSVTISAQTVLNDIYFVAFNKEISCCLTLSEDGYYSLELVDNQSAGKKEVIRNEEVSLLSIGTFKEKNNGEIILKDSFYSFSFVIKRLKDRTIKTLKGFPFMKNCLFAYLTTSKKSSESEQMEGNLLNKLALKKQRDKYNSLNNKLLYDLREGTYVHFYRDNIQLIITKNGNYQYIYKNILLSEGKYIRDANILTLKDVDLKYDFYMLITENGLEGNLLPTYEVGILYKFFE